jgi:uncharacterized membrane protein
MDKLIDYIVDLPQKAKKLDRATVARELKELAYHMNKQLFSQIPSVSAIAGILVGWWVAATFTNSPVKGFLSQVGFIKGGTHVVSNTTYKIISVLLPVLAMAVTAYAVQKAMKIYRANRQEKNMTLVAQLGQEVQSEIRSKIDILDKAKNSGLLSENEYRTKIANLYQSYSRNHTKIEDILFNKLEN